jgi:hypothetical protein
MPKDTRQGAGGNQDLRDLNPGSRDPYAGLGPSGGASDDNSSGDEPEDFVLSEESLTKIKDPTTKAIAAAALRSQRENAELRARIAEARNGNGGDEDDDEEDDHEEGDLSEELDRRIEAALGAIPEEGYEKLTPGLKKILGALIRDNASLRLRVEEREAREARQRPKDEFRLFQKANKGWEKHDSTMAKLVKSLGIKPATAEQFEGLLEIAERIDSGPELEEEVKTLRKSGPVPSLKAPMGPSVRNIVGNARKKHRAGSRLSMTDIFAEGLNKANQQLSRSGS